MELVYKCCICGDIIEESNKMENNSICCKYCEQDLFDMSEYDENIDNCR